MTDSYVQTSQGATSFVGPDAIALYRTMQLKSAIKFTAKTGMLMRRGATMKYMLAEASKITGKPYKGKKDADKAVADLQTWVDAMNAAIPIERK